MINSQKITKVVYCQLLDEKVKINLSRPLFDNEPIGPYKMDDCQSKNKCKVTVRNEKTKGTALNWKACPVMDQYH